jgi:hypothetical protein
MARKTRFVGSIEHISEILYLVVTTSPLPRRDHARAGRR